MKDLKDMLLYEGQRGEMKQTNLVLRKPIMDIFQNFLTELSCLKI